MRAPDFWTSDDWRSRLLAPAGWIYGASVAWNAARAKPIRPPVPVVCVGNLTAGGTGKTPVAIALAEILIAQGHQPWFLSRGYGGRLRGPVEVTEWSRAADVGDEPLLLARAAPVIVARDRLAGANLAVGKGATVIVMDDGHQNFALAKDLSLVVVDGDTGFGNGRMIPAGPLREPVARGLARADAVFATGSGLPPLGACRIPVLRVALTIEGPDIEGRAMVAFAGIGRPEKFFEALRAQGAILAAVQGFPDHHVYSAGEIARLRAKARAHNAELVTTEKDFVRLTASEREGIRAIPLNAAFEDRSAVERLLDRLPPKG
ncbi:MAG TPA: tetraacyldisaccharide 4'-kinase [Rhizomicrobium sp.]|jgi:tetraacyldisaccharide 4'-kinase|nr:tetraacyldisaccharide 4'-kinase [Rhizomicrobium sp.]